MIHFDYPEILLLGLPLGFVWYRYARTPGTTGWLRLVILVLLLFALSVPRLNLAGQGQDLIVVVDRSRSMPTNSDRAILDLVKDLESNRHIGDRISIVTFGGTAAIERELSESAVLGEYSHPIDADGSDLNEALLMALDRRTRRDRPARIIVLSDGLYNGASPLYAARRAREENVPIDFRSFSRPLAGDLSVESLELPRESAPDEPFQFSVVVSADQDATGTVIVRRDGVEIARRTADFVLGLNRLYFRDRIRDGGMHQYSAELVSSETSATDPVSQNNRGIGVVRVRSAPRLLLVTHDGTPGNLGRALESAKIPVDVVTPGGHTMTLDSLEPYRSVVLENVAADDLGRARMERLAQFVEDLGGGLIMTGGTNSFGNGGYYKSPIDDLLPVALDSIEETRRSRAAIVVVLDRSGSMAASVSGGKTKMDLANIGTIECVKLLSSQDMVSVIAVDSSSHVIQEMTAVNNPAAINQRVSGIQSMGGGIFVYTGLLAAGKELLKANNYTTRHIILFSDAADSEEPGDYKNLIKKFTDSGITVSVIGLGKDTDTDAEFLKDIALRGQGNIEFSDDPLDLPRLFAQDTMNMTRNMFLTAESEERTEGFAGQVLADHRLLGDLRSDTTPAVQGYNLTFLKEDATQGIVSTDDNRAPFSAFWYRGLGRVAAIPLELDGRYSGALSSWSRYEEFVAMHARWSLGDDSNNDAWVSLTQEGLNAVVTVELDPNREDRQRGISPTLVVIPPGDERTEPVIPDLVWTGPDTLEGRFRMSAVGTWRTLVKTGGREFTPGPALSLPYSPEYMPRTGLPAGETTLNSIAEISGGAARLNLLDVYNERAQSRALRSFVPWLCCATIFLLLTEIAGRRWNWWERIRSRRMFGARHRAMVEDTKSTPRKIAGRKLKEAVRKGKQLDRDKPSGYRPVSPLSQGDQFKCEDEAAADVFARAKQKAQKRLK